VCRNANQADAQLGTGDKVLGFVPLADGADLFVSLGANSMYMVTTSLRLTGFEQGAAGTAPPRVVATVRSPEKLLGAAESDRAPVQLEATDSVAFLGVQTVLYNDLVLPILESPTMTDVEVKMSLIDGCGRHVGATRHVRLRK